MCNSPDCPSPACGCVYLCENCREECSEDEAGMGYCRVCLPEKFCELADVLADLVDCGIVPSWDETQLSALEGIVANATKGRGYIAERDGAPRLPERTRRAR